MLIIDDMKKKEEAKNQLKKTEPNIKN